MLESIKAGSLGRAKEGQEQAARMQFEKAQPECGCAAQSQAPNAQPEHGQAPAEQTTKEQDQKKKRGRPRSFAKGSTVNISVTIETRQKEWLDEIAASAPEESASKVVREALDLWYAVHKEGKSLVGAPSQSSPWQDDTDDFDYSWQ